MTASVGAEAAPAGDEEVEMPDELPEYWYCLKHGTVETQELCPGAERMGPYPSREQAEHALELAAQRTEAWDKDPRWRDD